MGDKTQHSQEAWVKWDKLGESKRNVGMGFLDLKVFNLALLANQGWRLIKDPTSLMAQILREKYFPNDSFFTAQLGRAPSMAWQSIVKAWAVLEGGLRWRVRNGESVRIWGDKWLPSPNTFQVQSPVTVLDPSARVCSLINQATGWWDVALVRTIFQPEETEVICGMPISFLCQPNTMI